MKDETPHNAPTILCYHSLDALLDAGISYTLIGDFHAAFSAFDEIIGGAPVGSDMLNAAIYCKGLAYAARARKYRNDGDIKLSIRYLKAAREVGS